MQSVADAVEPPGPDGHVDTCLLQQQDEQLGRLQVELADISRDILSLDDDGGMCERESLLNKTVFELAPKD